MPEDSRRAERAIRQTVEQLRAEGIRVPNMTPPKPSVVVEVGPVVYRVTYLCGASWGPSDA